MDPRGAGGVGGQSPTGAPAGAPARTTRRHLLLTGSRGAVAAAAGFGVLTGCASRVPAGPRPHPAVNNPVVELTFMPWWTYWSVAGRALLLEVCARFAAAQAGVRLTPLPGPNGPGPHSAAVLASILSGTGPDVVCDYGTSFAQYVSTGAFADLQPYLDAEHIAPSTWSAAHMAALRAGSGQFGLPTFDGPCVYAYRQDILDALHIPYPSPEWTYADAADIWRRCALPNAVAGVAPTRYGATVWWWDGWRASNWLLTGFGGAEMDSSATRATFTDPNSLAAGEWLMELLWNGVTGLFDAGRLQDGTVVFALRGGWSIAQDVVAFGDRFKWDYLPAPVFPMGRATFSNNDFWGLNALGAHRDAAWALLKWLAYEDDWQRFCMKTALLQPCKLALWDEWEATMKAAAPPLASKALRWYRDAAQSGYGYAQRFFKYQPIEADQAIAAAVLRLNTRQVDVPTAFADVTAQINALEAAGLAVDADQAAAVRQVVALGGSDQNALLEPPQVAGLGTAAVPSPTLVDHSSGVYHVTGGGADVWGHSDNCTLAAVAENNSVGEYACRVTAMRAGTAPSLAPWAKVGLMVRGDLSDDAPMAMVCLTASMGIQTASRLQAGTDAVGQAAPAGSRTGLIAAPYLTATKPDPSGNALPTPLWLRLRRRGDLWSAWTSRDGQRWAQAGPEVPVVMAGAWVGVFVSAVNSVFPRGAGLTVVGTFDRLTFTSGVSYQVGAL